MTEKNLTIDNAVLRIPVPNWESFGSVISQQLGEVLSPHFAFRGQANSQFELVSCFDRAFGHLTPKRKADGYKRLEQIFAKLAVRYDIDPPEDSAIVMALAQHFGLATRMLDWSESRYIAAFFAFASLTSDFNSSLDAEDADQREVSVFAIDRLSSLWGRETVQIIDPENPGDNERIRRQRGLFTINRTEYSSIEEYVRQYIERQPDDVDTYPLYRFDLPASCARVALRDLLEMRISHAELFPGLEGIAKEAMLFEWLGNTPT